MLLVTVACKKEVLPETPDFRVKSSAVTFEAGKENAFEFEGTAGIISFYSGETGREYLPETAPDGINKAIPVKGNSDSRLQKYTYTYAVKGSYKAFFVAKNASIYGTREVVREISVTVTD